MLDWLRRKNREKQLTDEIAFHVDMAAEIYIRKGLPESEARRRAVLDLGGVEQVKESYREQRKIQLIDSTWKDLHYGLRSLRKSPGFTITAVLCLMLGVGATTAVFSWIEGILLRPFPAVQGQERMVAVVSVIGRTNERDDLSFPDLQDYEKYCTLVDSFLIDRIFGTTLSIGDRAERATGSVVSANYFQALGVRPILGRAFSPEEGTGRNAHPVTVISYQTWKSRFHGDPNIAGKTQMLNGVRHTIIGVAPENFFGTFVGYAFQFWVPTAMQEVFDAGGYKLEDRGARWIEGYAKLKPGVTIEQAQAEMSAVAQRLERQFPDADRGRGVRLYPLYRTPFNNAGTLFPTLRITLVVACFVLLIACANVGNLLLVRSFARRREMTVRLAVGAGRARLLRQLLTEGLILSILAAIGGLALAYLCRNMLVLFYPPRPGVTVNLPADIDWRVLLLSAGVCLVSTVLFGLVPAWRASDLDLAAALKNEAGAVIGARRRAYFRGGLVLLQVALSFVLLVGTGLLLKSLDRMRNISPGFATDGVLTTGFDLVGAGYDGPRARVFQDTLLNRLRAIPGIDSAAFARITPFSYRGYFSASIEVDGYHPAPDEQPISEYNQVGPGYLATTGVPLVRGREFTNADDENAAPVAVINEVMAARYFAGRDPVGQRLLVKGKPLRIVGIAKTAKYHNLIETPKPFFYTAMRQDPTTQVNISIKTRLGADAIAPAFGREIRAIDSNLAVSEIITMREQVDRMSWTQRAAFILLAIFCGVALILAAIGLYGVMAYAVSQRNRELGLRMALGASGRDLIRLVMWDCLALTLAGLTTGLAAAFGLTRLIADLLIKVSPHDPAAFVMAFVAAGVVALIACFIPALRAMNTDPVPALRE
jgi:predicted permease